MALNRYRFSKEPLNGTETQNRRSRLGRTRQSIDLFRRSPALALVNMGIFFGVNAFVPQPLELNVPATIFLLGGLFSGLRAADRDSGNVWAAAWAYFRETDRDLAHLSRDAFLCMLVFSLSLAIFFAVFHIATEGLKQDHSASTVRLYDARETSGCCTTIRAIGRPRSTSGSRTRLLSPG